MKQGGYQQGLGSENWSKEDIKVLRAEARRISREGRCLEVKQGGYKLGACNWSKEYTNKGREVLVTEGNKDEINQDVLDAYLHINTCIYSYHRKAWKKLISCGHVKKSCCQKHLSTTYVLDHYGSFDTYAYQKTLKKYYLFTIPKIILSLPIRNSAIS